jgi:3-hydroxyisobutyrate dehydrogenase
MRVSHMALAELNEALNRGWSDRDSRIGMLLQVERSGIEPLAVDPARIKDVVDRDG